MSQTLVIPGVVLSFKEERMKILLIAPSHVDDNSQPVRYDLGFLPSLALAHLAALTPERHEVCLVDAAVTDIPYDVEWDVVGMTAMTGQIDHAYQICDEFHSRYGSTRVVLGGVHPTLLPEEAAEYADIVVVGEAESVWERVLGDCESSGNEFQKCYYGEPWDMQTRILPKWETLDLDRYVRPQQFSKPQLPIFTTRGCPLGCDFCTVTRLFGKSYRQKPISNVLEELQATPAESYFFVDDNIVCRPEYSRELFRALKREVPDIRWFSQASTTILNHPDLIELAAESGCTSLFLGIESISDEALKAVHKGFNKVEKYQELFDRMYRAGVVPYVSLVFGLDETGLDIFEATLEFLQQTDIVLSAWWILSPIPGTPLYQRMKGEGRIFDRRWSSYNGIHKPVFTSEQFTPDGLERVYWDTYTRFWEDAYQRKQGVCDKYALPKRAVDLIHQNVPYSRFQVLKGRHPFSIGIKFGG